MTCIETQGLITPFINDTIDYDKLEEFLAHIGKCPDCKEELEVYYILLTGMKQLDEDKNLSGDFHLAFINKLKKAEEKIIKRKVYYIRKRIVLITLICLIGIFSGVRIGEIVVDDIQTENAEELKQSNFKFKIYFFEDKITPLKAYAMENMDKLLEYKQQHEIAIPTQNINNSDETEKVD